MGALGEGENDELTTRRRNGEPPPEARVPTRSADVVPTLYFVHS